MTSLRDHLAADLATKVNQYGLVVWQDTAREYSDSALSLCPPDTRMAAYDGSWYALRREVESLLAGDAPPRLVIYTSAKTPSDDPLEEIRAAGGNFTLRLATLVRKALKGQLNDQRLIEIGNEARTLEEAEAAVSSDGGGDIRLMSILGASDARTMALRILMAGRDEHLDREDLWTAAAELLAGLIGGSLTGKGDDLRKAALRQMILTEIAVTGGDLPNALASAWGTVNASASQLTKEILHTWRSDQTQAESYGALANQVDQELGLPAALPWTEGLSACTATPAIEEVVFREAVRRLAERDGQGAGELSALRLRTSPWVRPQGPAGEGWGTTAARWRSVQATADLQTAVDTTPPPKATSSADLLKWYVDSGWRVDRAHRRFEVARNELRVHGDLEPTFTSSRVSYEKWLETTLLAFTSLLERGGFDVGTLGRQGDIHTQWVRDAERPVAYVWVDALRYELGADLADGLRADGHRVQLYPAVGAAPTITPVGMANLTPGAGSGLELTLDDGDLGISIDGEKVMKVPERIARLRVAHGVNVLDRTLDVVAGQGEKELKRVIGDADLLLVRSQELDSAGESGMLNAAWSQFSTVLALLRNLVARLSQAGVRRIVITADHGFVTLSPGLGSDRSIDSPTGGTGDLHRRGWIGKGSSTTESTMRMPLSSTGVPSDLDLIVPRGLAVFRAGGSKQFFHGGLSPQELLVPVIVVDTHPAPAPKQLQVDVSVAGGRITTGAFAATIVFSGDLFTNEVTVRVVAQQGTGGGVVARVASGDGYDPDTGAVTLRSDGSPPVLTFQVTANLQRDSKVEIEVLDARTGVKLGAAEAHVAANIIVEDELE